MQNSTLLVTNIEQFTSMNVNANHQGVIGVALAGQVTNLDYILLDDCFLTGAILFAKTPNWGDTVSLQVFDLNNVMTFGANLVLGQYVTNWVLRADSQMQFDQSSTYPAKIKTGLILRVIYTSTGATDVGIAVNYKLQKALY